MLVRLIAFGVGIVLGVNAVSAAAQDNRLSTNCKLHQYSYPCLGYDMETAKRMIAEDDEKRAAALRKAAQEHDEKVREQLDRKAQAEAAEKKRRDQAAADLKRRNDEKRSWQKEALSTLSLPISLPAGTKWTAKINVSKFDDTPGINAYLPANEEVATRNRSTTPVLVMRCNEGVAALYIDWRIYIGTQSTTVQYRIDKAMQEQKTWFISSDHQATGQWNSSSSTPLITELASAQSLLVRITPYGEAPVSTSFDLAGVREVAANVRKACAL